MLAFTTRTRYNLLRTIICFILWEIRTFTPIKVNEIITKLGLQYQENLGESIKFDFSWIEKPSQLTFTCSKSTVETVEKEVKYI